MAFRSTLLINQWSWWWLKSFYKRHQLRFVVSCILYRCGSQIDVLTVVPRWCVSFSIAWIFIITGHRFFDGSLLFWGSLSKCSNYWGYRLYIEVIVGCIVISWNEGNCCIHFFENDSLTNFYIFWCKERPSNRPTGERLERLGRGGNILAMTWMGCLHWNGRDSCGKEVLFVQIFPYKFWSLPVKTCLCPFGFFLHSQCLLHDVSRSLCFETRWF